MHALVKIKHLTVSKHLALSTFLATLLLLKPSVVMAQRKECQDTTTTNALKECIESNRLIGILQDVVNFLSIGVGVVVVAMIIIGGIQYMTAGDNPNAVAAARSRILNALIALIAFIFTFSFLQWIIPGGVFG